MPQHLEPVVLVKILVFRRRKAVDQVRNGLDQIEPLATVLGNLLPVCRAGARHPWRLVRGELSPRALEGRQF